MEKKKEEHLRNLFSQIHKILSLELETIRLIKREPPNKKELVLLLFRLIFFRECDLFLIFTNREEGVEEETNSIRDLAMKILLEEKIVEEIETDEEIFAKKMVKEMTEQMRPGDFESLNSYRRLGEYICDTIMEMAAKKVNGEGLPLQRKNDEIIRAVDEFDRLIDDEELIYKIVKQKRRNYDDAKIRMVVSAFCDAFNIGHFEDLINFAD